MQQWPLRENFIPSGLFVRPGPDGYLLRAHRFARCGQLLRLEAASARALATMTVAWPWRCGGIVFQALGLVGGHLEANERREEALRLEVKEEIQRGDPGAASAFQPPDASRRAYFAARPCRCP